LGFTSVSPRADKIGMTRSLSLTSSDDPSANNRRRRSRIHAPTQGWILPPNRRLGKHAPADDEAWEVHIEDLSRFGIGFTSTERLGVGEKHQMRIGRGPMKRSRTIRVASCREARKGIFLIGAEFVASAGSEFAKAG
jgi:hypothetical protein